MQLGCPKRSMGKNIDEAPDERTRIIAILGRKRQPLRHHAAGLQTRRGEGVKVRGIKIGHTRSRGRRRFESNEMVGLAAFQQLPPAVIEADFNSRIIMRPIISNEIR